MNQPIPIAAAPGAVRRSRKVFVVALTAVALLVIGGYWAWNRWTAPYDLPPIPAGLTREAVGLDMTREQQSSRAGGGRTQAPPGAPVVDAAAAQAQYEAALALLAGGTADQEQGLAYLQSAVRSDPENLVYGNALRATLLQRERFDDLRQVWQAMPNLSAKGHIQAALAQIDAMHDPHSGNANLGRYSMQAAEHLDAVIAENPHHWLAHYARGLNHLYWPTGFQRTGKAVSDLSYALAIQKSLPDHAAPYFAFTYAALGDALVKQGKVQQGVQVWREGLEAYPESEALRARGKAGVDGARDLVRAERGIEDFFRPLPGVTDLSSLWQQPSALR